MDKCPKCGWFHTNECVPGGLDLKGGDRVWITASGSSFYAVQEPTIGTYTEPEIVKAFAERKRFREALEQIIRWQEGSVGTMRQDATTINYAQAALKGFCPGA